MVLVHDFETHSMDKREGFWSVRSC